MGNPDPAAWLGLAIALVVLANFGLADPIRYTLIAVILLVLLRHASALAPALDRFTRALGGTSGTGSDGSTGRVMPR
jgi:hypothetical protein